MAKNEGKKRAYEAIITALSCGSSIEEAANKTGVSRRTVQRRLEDAAFMRKLQSARAAILSRTSSVLTAASLASVKTLLTLQEVSYPPAVRLGAARATLEIGIRVRETVELEERLLALEDRITNDKA